MKLRKIRRSVRIVRIVRTENGFTDRTNRTAREKDLRIVNRVFNRWKRQLVTKWSLEKFVDPYGSHGPYELKIAIKDREISCPGSHIWLAQINRASYINNVHVILVEDNLCIANCWRWIFSYEKRMWYCEAFNSCLLYTCYEQSWHGIKCHRQ